ncbi:MAG: DUF4320 family protein [Oscillospiraceae bacterium]
MKIINKLKQKQGDSSLVPVPFIVVLFVGLLFFQIQTLGQTSKIDKLEQMASLIAREISLTGSVDKNIENRLNYLENNVFNMDVDLDVNGDFKGGSKKLQLESDFEVVISYDTEYKNALLKKTKEKTYYGKAVGKVENYSKG